MSYYATEFLPGKKCGPCVYEMEDLDLSEGGLPGLVFWGTLDIEPTDDGLDWFIERATALNNSSGVYTVYDEKHNAAIFHAIVKAVNATPCAYKHITYHAREYAE